VAFKFKPKISKGFMKAGLNPGKFFFTGLFTRFKSGKFKVSLPKGTEFTKITDEKS